jgi:hypothetical protein
MADSPFVSVSVACPICKQSSQQRYLKSKLFQPGRAENDQHVIDYIWENPLFSRIRPNFYYLWHCPQCHYVDEREIFRGEGVDAGKMEVLKDKFLIVGKAPNNPISILGKAINHEKEEISVETAITTHTLGIFIQEVLSPNLRQTGKIAKFYLRTAWLYREKAAAIAAGDTTPEESPAGFSTYSDFMDSVAALWPEAPTSENKAMGEAAAMYELDMNQRKTNDPKFSVNIMNMLSFLYERMGKYHDALRYVRSVFSTAAQARNAAKMALQRKTGGDVKKLTSLASWMDDRVETARERSEALGEVVFKEELPKAKEVILQMKNPTADEVANKLRELKFASVTVGRLSALFQKK